jgi:GDP-4-dehydro-6-deoxy-D-mannose reductase
MSRKRILITGVGGFVGSYLAHRIAERGDDALGAGIEGPPPATERFLTRHWRVDVRDGETLRAVLAEAEPTAIVHLAAQSSGALSFERPVETYSINAVGTLSLLEAVSHAAPRSRVLVVGTGEVYGPNREGTRVVEDAVFHPMSPYALSKAAADTIAMTCARLWSLDVVRTRSFGHVAPGQTDRFLVPSLARQIAEIETAGGEGVVRVGNLDVVRDLTDARDVVEAYLELLDRGRSGAAYNVCRGEGARLADLANFLCERSRRRVRIEVDPARVRKAEVRYLVGDPGAIHRDTGWKAKIPLQQTLEDVLQEWRNRVSVAQTPSRPI